MAVHTFPLPPKIQRPHYEDLEKFGFSAEIRKCLKGIKCDTLSSLEKLVGPNVIAGHDAIIVASDSDDKSRKRRMMAYMLPIFSDLLSNPSSDADLRSRVLVVCANKTSSRNLNNLINDIGDCFPHCSFKINFCEGLHKVTTQKADVRIIDYATLHSKSHFPNVQGNLFRGVKYLVFEECEQHFQQDVNFIPELISITEQHSQFISDDKSNSLVLIFATNKWTSCLEGLYLDLHFKQKRNIITYFNSNATPEFVKFVNIAWTVTKADDETEKLKLLKGVLVQGFAPEEKIAIACSTDDKAQTIQDLCTELKLKSKIVSSVFNVPNEDTENWEPEILIIPDERKASTKVTSCTYLLCLDDQYVTRLDYLKEHFGSPDASLQRKNPVAHFLITGKEPSFFKFYRITKKIGGVQIPEELEKIGSEMRRQQLFKKPLCDGIKLFGYCNSLAGAACGDRHEFNETDLATQPVIPCYGEIEFTVVACKSPTEYECVLLNHRFCEDEINERQHSLKDEREKYAKLLNEHAAKEELKAPSTYKMGEMYALYDEKLKNYKPVILLRRAGTIGTEIERTDKVEVQDIDTGGKLPAIAKDLFSLPSSLKRPTPPVTIIYGNLGPLDKEKAYSLKECQRACKLTACVRTCMGKVWLSMGNTIWVTHFTYKSEEGTKQLHDLLHSPYKLTTTNDPHINYLITLVQKLGDNYPGHQHLTKIGCTLKSTNEYFHKLEDGIQWSHIDISKIDSIIPTTIRTTYVISPWHFYGVCENFEKLVDTLEKELSVWASSDIYSNYNVSQTKFIDSLQVGAVVTVKYQDESEAISWVRGLVENIKGGALCNTPRSFDILLVDYGEKLYDVPKSDVLPIPKNLVSRLPFQAIGFSLTHIEPTKGSKFWDQEAKQTFMDIMLPNGIGIYFDAAVTYDCTNTRAHCYDVIGVFEDHELGGMLVQRNVASESENVAPWVHGMLTAIEGMNAGESLFTDEENSGDDFYDNFDVNLTADNKFDPIQKIVEATTRRVQEIRIKQTCTNDTLKNESSKNETPESSTKHFEPKKSKRTKKVEPSLPVEKSYIVAKFCPKVMWHQSQTHVILTVMLTDIVDFTFKVEDDYRSVSLDVTTPPNYGFQMQLFGIVETDWSHVLTGQQLKLYLRKGNPNQEKWSRLLKNANIKLHWLISNTDYIDEEENEEECAAATKNKITSWDDDDEDDDDDAVEIVEEERLFKAKPKFKLDVDDSDKISAQFHDVMDV